MSHDATRTPPAVGPGGWRYYGAVRPPFAVEPAPGQESVWDYPRPPGLEADAREVVVRVGEVVVARTHRAVRVLETASPPTVYIPREDVVAEYLHPAPGASHCEWKGTARYWTVRVGDVVLASVGWSYDDPAPAFEAIREHLSFYPGRIVCEFGGVRVEPQAGGFYGGWVTPEIVAPLQGWPRHRRLVTRTEGPRDFALRRTGRGPRASRTS